MPIKNILSYRGIRDFAQFSSQVCQAAREYKYVAARERRGFNLLYDLWTGESDLLTVSGLLACAGEIVEEYAQTGVFPRILMVDDLAIYGRGITKSVSQLRDVVYGGLEAAYPGRFSEERFVGDFKRSVDVRVFAASEKARLLASGAFSFRTFSGRFSSMRDIHDMSLQFSQAMAGSDEANTSFSFSVWCDRPQERMEEFSRTIQRGWSRISLDYEGAQTVVYIKPCGGPGIRRFKTLRFFPNQREDSLKITSFPLVGVLDGATARELCRAGMQVAQEENLSGIGRLLGAEHAILQPGKAQLLMFLMSMLDFQDFLRDFSDDGAVSGEWSTDLRKIVCNFGGGDSLMEEFLRIVFDKPLQKHIRQILEPFLDGAGNQLLQYGLREFAGLDISLEGTAPSSSCINTVSRYLWEMGVQDEKEAVKVADRPYWFEPLDYQEQGSSAGQILKDLVSVVPDVETACGRIAVMIAAMDRGLEGPMLRVEEDGETQLLLKVGEISTFYQMKKYAAYIPALARVEEFYYLRYHTPKEAVAAFLKKAGIYDEDLMQVYEYRQTFADWNFANLIRVSSNLNEAAVHSAEAEEFILGERLAKA